jgi:hypothetical protein
MAGIAEAHAGWHPEGSLNVEALVGPTFPGAEQLLRQSLVPDRHPAGVEQPVPFDRRTHKCEPRTSVFRRQSLNNNVPETRPLDPRHPRRSRGARGHSFVAMRFLSSQEIAFRRSGNFSCENRKLNCRQWMRNTGFFRRTGGPFVAAKSLRRTRCVTVLCDVFACWQMAGPAPANSARAAPQG